MSQESERALRLGEAAKILAVSPRTLRSWGKKGTVKMSRPAGGNRGAMLVPWSEIQRIIRGG